MKKSLYDTQETKQSANLFSSGPVFIRNHLPQEDSYYGNIFSEMILEKEKEEE